MRRPGGGAAAAPLRAASTDRKQPGVSQKDLTDARALARYGESGGWFGAMFYALHFWFRRRTLIKKLRLAKVEAERAVTLRQVALRDLGEGLHRKNGQIDLSRVVHFVDHVDKALMARETAKRGLTGRLKRDPLQKELTEHYKRLAEAAVERGIARAEAQGWGKLQLAERAVKRTQRTAYLTELGIDLYDPVWVKRGAVLFWFTVLFIIATGVVAATTR